MKDRSPGAADRAAEVAERADLLPHADSYQEPDAAIARGAPTGMFAGETDIDLAAEAGTRAALDADVGAPTDRWKHSGAVPEEHPIAQPRDS